jgi:hypothetical protein
LLETLLDLIERVVNASVEWTQRNVQGITEWALDDPSNRVHSIHDVQNADLGRGASEVETAVSAAC